MLTTAALRQTEAVLLWGFMATVAMITIMQGSQGLGLSRLSLPFLVGTLFTANRRWANLLGLLVYVFGGWLFTLLYLFIFRSIGASGAWVGGAIGLVHGVFLLVVILPLLPAVHPRIATEYDGPSDGRRLEPPGFMGLNYGYRTPLVALAGHIVFGVVLGAQFSLP